MYIQGAIMKRYKLHKKKHLHAFIQECMLYCSTITRARISNHEIIPENALHLYNLLMQDFNLWQVKQYCLLNVRVRNTFEYYNSLSYKKKLKELTK